LFLPAAVQPPHEIQRLAGMSMGLSPEWLGYAPWSKRQAEDAQIPQSA